MWLWAVSLLKDFLEIVFGFSRNTCFSRNSLANNRLSALPYVADYQSKLHGCHGRFMAMYTLYYKTMLLNTDVFQANTAEVCM